MAFCTKCGAQVQGPFCGSCGAPAPGTVAGAPATVAPPAPAPLVGPAAAQKTNALAWILGGCGALIVLGAIAVGLSTYYIAHKARQVARNPALAVTRMIAALNPDVEVVSVDEDKGVITVRDKKTGKTLTMNLRDAQNGKFVFEQEGNKVEMEAHADGDKGSFEVKSSEGSMKFGAGAAAGKIPDWMPAYPGSTPAGVFSIQNDQGATGSFHFSTGDSIEQVVGFYNDAFKKAGMKATTNSVQQNGKTSYGIVTAEEEGAKRKAMVNATVAGSGTNVGITFSAPR